MSKSESVIILVNYNSWKDTLECIASLSLIKIRRFSVIVVDNCSIDDSYMKLKEELIKYPFVVLLKSEFNGGFAKGNNIAISYARKNIKPQYIWLLNNDTIIKDDALSPLIQFLESNRDVGIVGSKLLYFLNQDTIQAIGGRFNKWYGKMKIIGFNEKDDAQFNDFDEPLDFVIGASILIHESFIQKVGLMNEEYFLYFEEIDWSLRARKLGLATKCCPASVVYHKEGSSTGNDSRSKINLNAMYFHLRNLIVFYKKYYPVYTPISILVVCYRIIKTSFFNDWSYLILVKQIFFQKPRNSFEIKSRAKN